LRVIVGKGIHSQGHVAKIKPAVQGLMQKWVPSFTTSTRTCCESKAGDTRSKADNIGTTYQPILILTTLVSWL
jgi:hypothetical protein